MVCLVRKELYASEEDDIDTISKYGRKFQQCRQESLLEFLSLVIGYAGSWSSLLHD